MKVTGVLYVKNIDVTRGVHKKYTENCILEGPYKLFGAAARTGSFNKIRKKGNIK